MKVFENYALNRFLASLLGGGGVLLALALCLPSAFAAQKVAVIADDVALESKLIEALDKAGYIVVERNSYFMQKVQKELAYQQSGNVVSKEIIALGEQYGISLVCVVNTSLSAGSTYITARLLDLKTAQIIKPTGLYSELDSPKEVLKVADQIIQRLLGIKPSAPLEWLIGYRASLTSPYGLSLGVCKRFGGYAQVRLNLLNVSERQLITDVYEGEGSQKYLRRSYTGGAMVRVQDWLFLYGGAGYGQYGATYVNGNKYYCPDLVSGLELEGGAMFAVWHLTASVGYSTIPNFQQGKVQFGEIHFGIGVKF
jgi:hypothetical protein